MPSMDELRLDPVAASVAAWHNRQPLACRIGLAQVLSVGVVRLPFVAAAKGRPRPVFSEDFLPPWSARRIGRWVARHGQPFNGELADEVPRRDVAVDPKRLKPGETPVTLLVRTAVVEVGGRQRRVLIGPGARPAVLGRAFLHRPRLALAAGLACALVAGSAFWVQRLPARGAGAVPAWSAASAAATLAAEAASAAAAQAAAARAASAASVATAALPASGPASAAAVAPAAAETAVAEAAVAEAAASAAARPPPPAAAVTAPPPDVAPRWGRVDLPAKPVILARPKAPVFGLASPVLRTEGESERVQGLMQRLLAKAGAGGVHVERLQVGEDWRIVGYPFRDRDDAERIALALVKGGLRTEVVDF